MRGFFGGGADTRFWRIFQKAIADVRTDFCPDGLTKYWEDEAKTYNDESSSYLREIENILKEMISSRLEEEHGANWLIHGLPKPIYTKAKKDADAQNYDIIARGSLGESVSIWDCVDMADCKEIITYGRNWSELFEDLLTRPEDHKLRGGKDKKTEWIAHISSVRNKLSKISYSVSTDEYDFIISVYNWLIDIEKFDCEAKIKSITPRVALII